MPGAALGALHQLTALHLAEAFTASWSGGEWDARLACLSSLTRLVLLDLSGNELPRIPSSVTGLTSLLTVRLCLRVLLLLLEEKRRPVDVGTSPRAFCLTSAPPSPPPPPHPQLNMGLNPVTDGGILCGPYLLHLAHLDLRAACVAELPQARPLCSTCWVAPRLAALAYRRQPARDAASGMPSPHLPCTVPPPPLHALQHLTTAQQLTFLGLSCCHDLLLDE